MVVLLYITAERICYTLTKVGYKMTTVIKRRVRLVLEPQRKINPCVLSLI